MKPFYNIMFFFSVSLIVASVAAVAMFGLNLGVDFTGGSIMQVEFDKRPSSEEVTATLQELKLPALQDLTVNEAGQKEMIIRSGPLTEDEHQAVLTKLNQKFLGSSLTEAKFDSVGPTVGEELKRKSLSAIIILLVAVLAYIAFMFRKLSKSLSLWAMAAGTTLGLAHDILLPIGLFAILGEFQGVQITAVYVAAVLTILGYTVSDKVVIYDRVRENILRGMNAPLPEIVHVSVMQTLIRSINNTLTVVLSSLAIFLFGGESIKYFALALIVGVASGAYSSIFIASPLLVWLSGKSKR